MANVLNFGLINSVSQPLTGSKCILRPYGSTGSLSTEPIVIYSDANGTASYSNVQPALYSFKWSNAGYASQSFNNGYQNYEFNEKYILIPTVTGSIDGFQYIINFVSSSYVTGSGQGTETQLDVSIPAMANYILGFLQDWATQNQGMAFLADDDNEKINAGFNGCVGPKVLLVFTGEQSDGELSELTGRVKRTFDVIVKRGKLLTFPRDNALIRTNGSSRAFYDLIEEVRDVVRGVIFSSPMVYNPVIYNDTRPGAQDNWMMDSYILNFTILCSLGRMQTLPPQIDGGMPEYIQLTDPMNSLNNTTP